MTTPSKPKTAPKPKKDDAPEDEREDAPDLALSILERLTDIADRLAPKKEEDNAEGEAEKDDNDDDGNKGKPKRGSWFERNFFGR